MKPGKRILSALLGLTMLVTTCSTMVFADNAAGNLVAGGGTFDNILTDGEQERTLNGDWGVSYPVATFGGEGADSPAKVRNVDGNNVLVLEYSTGNFASYFADLYADGVHLPAGEYELSMDLKPVGDGFGTDNVGFNLYNQYTDIRVYERGWKDCTELADGWLHYSRTFQIAEGSVDSIQMWFNTMGLDPSLCALYIDNLSIAPAAASEPTSEPTADPEVSELTAEYTVNSGAPITIAIPNSIETVVIAEKAGYTLEEDLDYTYADGVITLMNDYADGLASGVLEMTVTADGTEYPLLLTIKKSKPALPESPDGYLLQETLIGGDFEMFNEGQAFSLEQIEGWGTNVTYDDPAVVIVQDGNKVLRLQKDKKTSFSSAFAFISPTIQAGDILSLSFDYRLDVQDPSVYTAEKTNFCFVSASNMAMGLIPLDGSRAPETSGDGDYQWDVQYTDLENDWVRVEMTFIASAALLSYNSMRFLLPTDQASDGDAMYIDNVSLKLWAEPEPPVTVSTEALNFDRDEPADVFAMIDLKALDPQQITCGDAVVDGENWSINPAKDTITMKKEYLSTLANGDYTFTVTTAGGSCDFVIHVEGDTPPAGSADSGWIWIVIAVVVVIAAAAVVVVVLQKKKKGGKSA